MPQAEPEVDDRREKDAERGEDEPDQLRMLVAARLLRALLLPHARRRARFQQTLLATAGHGRTSFDSSRRTPAEAVLASSGPTGISGRASESRGLLRGIASDASVPKPCL